jgi:hypothetical protein
MLISVKPELLNGLPANIFHSYCHTPLDVSVNELGEPKELIHPNIKSVSDGGVPAPFNIKNIIFSIEQVSNCVAII